jgi:hypothetical protein
MAIVQKPTFLRNTNAKLIDTSHWSDFTYLSDQETMLNVRKTIEHNVVMNVKILFDQDIG